MSGSATFRWRCRKIVHHFVMFHGYRSDRGRVASHSVQPARNGAYHEGRVWHNSRGSGWEGVCVSRYKAPRWTSCVLIYRTRPGRCSSSLGRVVGLASVSAWVCYSCVRISSGNPRGARWLPLDSLLLIRSRSQPPGAIPTPTYLVSPRVSM